MHIHYITITFHHIYIYPLIILNSPRHQEDHSQEVPEISEMSIGTQGAEGRPMPTDGLQGLDLAISSLKDNPCPGFSYILK